MDTTICRPNVCRKDARWCIAFTIELNWQKSYLARQCCRSEDAKNDEFSAYRRLLNNLTENLYEEGIHSAAYTVVKLCQAAT